LASSAVETAGLVMVGVVIDTQLGLKITGYLLAILQFIHQPFYQAGELLEANVLNNWLECNHCRQQL
jgi:hypothetical protein